MATKTRGKGKPGPKGGKIATGTRRGKGAIIGPKGRTVSPVRIRCSSCAEANLVKRTIDHDVGALIDHPGVQVSEMPALVCPKCGAVSVEGPVLDKIALVVAVSILQCSEIHPLEVRFLRKQLGDTQAEFAERLGVARVTENRWENGEDVVLGPEAYAIRSHAFFRLRERGLEVEAAEPAFVTPNKTPTAQPMKLAFSGGELRAA